MSEPDIDFEGVADLADAIEAAGGDVRDFETDVQAKTSDGLFDAMSSLLGNSHERVYLFTVAIPNGTQRPAEIVAEAEEDNADGEDGGDDDE